MVEEIRSTLETGQQETEDIISGASFVFSNKWRKIPEVPDQNQEDIIATAQQAQTKGVYTTVTEPSHPPQINL